MQLINKIILSFVFSLFAVDVLASDYIHINNNKQNSTNNSNNYNDQTNFYSDKYNNASSNNFYGKISGGFGYLNSIYRRESFDDSIDSKHKYKSVRYGGVGVGFEFNENFRTELVLNYFKKAVTNDSAGEYTPQTTSFKIFNPMLQGIYQYNIGGMTNIYLIGGIGLAQMNYSFTVTDVVDNIVSISKKFKSFAYSFGSGLSFDLTNSLSLDLGYKYTAFNKGPKTSYALGDISFTDSYKILKFQTIEISLRFKF